MSQLVRSTALALALSLTVPLAPTGTASAEPAPAKKAEKTTQRADFLRRYARLDGRIFDLCEKMTEAQLQWRPGKGVRSMLEALNHLTETQYKLAEFVGAPIPKGIKLEAIHGLATKNSVLAALKASHDHTRNIIDTLSDADMDRAATVWGQPRTVRFAVLLIVAHSAEHLGQAIAYGRMQGVVPPWSK